MLMQCQAKENSVEYLMHEIWVDTCNQNKTVLIGFLLATSFTVTPTVLNVVLELSPWCLGVQTGRNQNMWEQEFHLSILEERKLQCDGGFGWIT